MVASPVNIVEWWIPVIAVSVAIVMGIIDLHRTAGEFWYRVIAWSVGLLVVDGIAAFGLSLAAPGLLPSQAESNAGVLALSAAIAGAVGARTFSLIPIPGGKSASKRFVTARRYVLDEVARVALLRRTSFIIDKAYPAARNLDEDELRTIATLLIEERQRAGQFPSNRRASDIVSDVLDDTVAYQTRVECILAIIIDHCGMAACREIIKRSKRSRHRLGTHRPSRRPPITLHSDDSDEGSVSLR